MYDVHDRMIKIVHYKNMSLKYTQIFSAVKIENFIGIILIFVIVFLKTLIVGTL